LFVFLPLTILHLKICPIFFPSTAKQRILAFDTSITELKKQTKQKQKIKRKNPSGEKG